MKHTRILVGVLLVLTMAMSLEAGNALRVGTAGGVELLIPVGSRGTAMGGSIVARPYGLESIYWNPAGLATIEGSELMVSHLPYIADIDVNFGGIATNVEGFGVLAASAKVVSIGDMEEYTDQATEGTGRVFNPTLTVLTASFARQLTASVAFGTNAMYINESIFEVSANGFAFDMGFIYDPRWKGMSFGLAIKNYGPQMRFSGRGFENLLSGDARRGEGKSIGFDLPSYISMGMAYNFLNQDMHSASFTGTFRSNNFQEDMWQGGAEYSYNERYFLRAGYNFQDNDDYLFGASFGAGLTYPVGETTKLSFEYSWTETEVFDDNQYFTLRVNF